eukprot:scaffold77778_cov69-Phaeocystis_antarctica.AAC.1
MPTKVSYCDRFPPGRLASLTQLATRPRLSGMTVLAPPNLESSCERLSLVGVRASTARPSKTQRGGIRLSSGKAALNRWSEVSRDRRAADLPLR